MRKKIVKRYAQKRMNHMPFLQFPIAQATLQLRVTPTRNHTLFNPQPLYAYATLLLALSVPAKATSAHGTLSVSMQVLPSCSTFVEKQTATVNCPPGFAFSMTRTQNSRTLPDATQATTQTVTIRY